MDLNNLEEESVGQRKKQQITILVKDYSKKWSRSRQFKIIKNNKPRVNLKHLAYHTLLQSNLLITNTLSILREP